MTAPALRKISATVDLPVAMPPVNPATITKASVCWGLGLIEPTALNPIAQQTQ
jgi:hypothetical protein